VNLTRKTSCVDANIAILARRCIGYSKIADTFKQVRAALKIYLWFFFVKEILRQRWSPLCFQCRYNEMTKW